eukprot:TRINITY_DN67209_c5_g2_i1.p1 TRINITY_DN67209_c5_g2~~TRINITY_DN67209_c5_g2_i1.p1  ORF type:complete len:423 (+),score=85.92 TRINITY_DN67209_c5_g2_i1:164-1270(+)
METQNEPISNYELVTKTLQLTTMVIESAKVENNDEALCSQAIRAFKVDNTQRRWEEIKNLTSDAEWAKVKEQLVVFMLQNKNSDAKGTVDLLLGDGLWKQCVGLFPDPSTLENKKRSTDMADWILRLTKLAHMVATSEPKDSFCQLFPMFQRYIKRYYQDFKFPEVDGLFDVIQSVSPSFLIDLFPTLIDITLLNIIQSQYGAFVKCMRKYKHRLVKDLGMEEEWERFYAGFQKKHRGKKRLVQMVILLGDSQIYTNIGQKRPPTDQDADQQQPEKKKKLTTAAELKQEQDNTTTSTGDRKATTGRGVLLAKAIAEQQDEPEGDDFDDQEDDNEDEEEEEEEFANEEDAGQVLEDDDAATEDNGEEEE